jgi:hypothetical protein
LLTGCSAVVLAACGGEDGMETRAAPPPPPRIEASVAEPLAARSENVARFLESGDRCAAANEAALLEQEVIAAINNGAVPDLYLEDLGSVAHEIAAQVPACEPPSDEDEDDEGKGKGKGKDKRKKDKGGDDD